MWKKFVYNLQNGNYRALNRALVYIVSKFSGLILALPTIIVLWILKPFFWVRVGKLHHARIGHLALETDLFLRKRQLGIFPEGPFYCFLCDSRNVANRQLLTMFKRVMRIYECRVLVAFYDGMFPLLKKTPFYQPLGVKNNEYYEFNNANSSIYFTSSEIQKGRELLKHINVDFDHDTYVCIFARDSTFLDKTMPSQNWSYHNKRDSDIDSFIEAIKYLIEKGLTVIRVGSVVNKPISYSHPKLIDYSVSEFQGDFLDIFLAGTCKFFLGSPSGISDLSTIFDNPMANVQMSEFDIVPFGKNCIYIPKKFNFVKTGQYLKFKEGVKLKLNISSNNFEELGLELEDNSPQDILEVTQEMMARTEGVFQYSPEEEKLMESFKELMSQSDIHCRNVENPIGIEWLKKNKDFISKY
jgi:putative glycosyltransferase (TIGR04372 family)